MLFYGFAMVSELKLISFTCYALSPVTPGFRDPWMNRGEGARGDRDEPEGDHKQASKTIKDRSRVNG